jgi:hypothetical protein
MVIAIKEDSLYHCHGLELERISVAIKILQGLGEFTPKQ